MIPDYEEEQNLSFIRSQDFLYLNQKMVFRRFKMNFLSLPKIELHCHLDGSLRAETIIDIAREEGIQLPYL